MFTANSHQMKYDNEILIEDKVFLLMRKKRRSFYHPKCLLCVMAAFAIGLAVGIFLLPLLGLASAQSTTRTIYQTVQKRDDSFYLRKSSGLTATTRTAKERFSNVEERDVKSANVKRYSGYKSKDRKFDILLTAINNNLLKPTIFSSVSFILDEKISRQNVASSLNNGPTAKLNNVEYGVLVNGGDVTFEIPEVEDHVSRDKKMKRDKKNVSSNDLDDNAHDSTLEKNFIDNKVDESKVHHHFNDKAVNRILQNVIRDDIFWSEVIEKSLPAGFGSNDAVMWRDYVESNTTEIIKIERGCGRMQNRLVTFNDGVKACVRYRQNTDQIQGELFSFYLGQLLNLTNLVPSSAAVVNWDARLWSKVKENITQSQWKLSRPVVMTKWIPIEQSLIPDEFRPLERHLNKDDVRKLAIVESALKPSNDHKQNSMLSDQMLKKFVELAQWSDLIVFDYLIANLDRVVNNLYNFQWNADIMAAPAHNLARKIDSQLLVFLDNESGLLHGYRLLQKYEAYHNLLLENLCIFRKSTIDSLMSIRDKNPGVLINEVFGRNASTKVRRVLPPLPDKNIKILKDRIDRIIQQVHKCRNMFSSS